VAYTTTKTKASAVQTTCSDSSCHGVSPVGRSWIIIAADAGSNLLATIDQALVNGTATGTPITRYNHTDNLGSTNVTPDFSMNVAQWFDYAPYGSVIATTNTGQTTAGRQYINRFADQSNLDYMNARYYNPSQGQFITQDPVFWSSKQNLANPQSLNSYSYSNDNPIQGKIRTDYSLMRKAQR
jgi:RHS repeat-associated protein